jgi:hypothetical protein
VSSTDGPCRPRDLAVFVLLAVVGCRKAAPTAMELAAAEEAVAVEEQRDASDERVEGVTGTLALVTIDGARWQDVVDGADPTLAEGDVGEWAEPEEFLPHVHALIQRGVLLGGDSDGRRPAVRRVDDDGDVRPSRCSIGLRCGPRRAELIVDGRDRAFRRLNGVA